MVSKAAQDVSGPAPLAPPRQSGSIRRTMTLDTRWPDGEGGDMDVVGSARDLYTPRRVDSAPRTVREDGFTARLTPERRILRIDATGGKRAVAELAGSQGGKQLRGRIGEVLPEELDGATPLYLLLDDLAGASLVAGWAFSQWVQGWEEALFDGPESDARRQRNEGVCIGFSPSSPVMIGSREDRQHFPRIVPALDSGADRQAWHSLSSQDDGPGARRARRLDVRLDGNTVRMNAHFQDSASRPDGQRMGLHEYLITATADRETMTLRSLDVDPRVLPFGYCPMAVPNTARLIGTPLGDLRQAVLAELPRTLGCTHLNDMLRSLADVPQLAATIEQQGEGAL